VEMFSSLHQPTLS